MELSQMFNKLKGGNYHEYYRNHHSRCSVAPNVRRGRRLLVEQTRVVVISRIILTQNNRRDAAMRILSLFYWMLTKKGSQGLRGDCHPHRPDLK